MTSPVALLRVDIDPRAAHGHPRHRHPALDLKYIQAGIAATSGVVPTLIDHTLAPRLTAAELAARVLAGRPRVAIVKAQTWNLALALDCARRLRAAGVVTIAVGQQVLHAQRCAVAGWHEGYDFALPGDPEAEAPRAVAALLAGADAAALRARYAEIMASGRLPDIAEPDALPPPRFDAAELAAYPFPFPLRRAPVSRWGYLLTAWGCPRACRHCSVVVRKSSGMLLRARSVEQVLDEAARLADAGVQGLVFEDDSLCVDRRRFLALCDALVRRRIALPWIANARPDELDAERVAAAAASGAALLKVGVDCASPRLIERIGKARDGAAWISGAEDAFARLDAAGIASVALFMVGLPDEDAAGIEASIELARRLRPDYVQVQIYTPYPDAPLWAELGAAQPRGAGGYHYGAPGSSPSRLAAADLPVLQARFYRRFYFDPAYVARHLRRNWRHYLAPQAWPAAAAHGAYLLRGALSGHGTSHGEAPQREAEQA